MKVIVEHTMADNIPVLHVCKEDFIKDELPLVVFIHGFTSAKEHNLHIAYLLAEKGLRVVLPDAKFHGERDENLSEADLNLNFWNIVISSVKELEKIKNYFFEKELIDGKNIGVAGTSMGGVVTLGALTQYPWIKAAVSLMGSPNYQEFFKYLVDSYQKAGYTFPLSEEEIQQQFDALYEYDLSVHKEALCNRPLLFWHGMKDQVVPFAPTYQFYEEIKPLYADNPEHLAFIAEKDAGHKVSRKGVLETVEWFVRHLR